MSFVTAVRDYVDLINASFDSFQQTFGSEMTLAALLKGTSLYLWQSVKIAFLYVVTLQWLRDLAYLPVIIPNFTFDSFRTVFVKYPSLPVTTSAMSFLSGAPTLVQNKFVVGFFNSFFASLPLTFAHLISARQFYVKGWRAAAATNAGIIAGHLFFLSAVLFGWRPVLLPWLQFEPGTFVIAITVTYYTVKSTFGRAAFGRAAFQKMLTLSDFAKTAAIGFLLMLCDQGVIFKYLSTLTGGLEPTYLEPVTGTVSSAFTQQHFLYLGGFLIGSLVFTAFFFCLADLLRQWITSVANITNITFASRVNSWSQIASISILCVSFSFYGLDFVCAKPLGFVPYDRALVPGTFASYTLEDKRLGIAGVPSKQDSEDETQPEIAITKQQKAKMRKKSVFTPKIFPIERDFDLSTFDRGVYLRQAMGSTHETKTFESYRIPTSEFWASRTARRKRPRTIFAKILRKVATWRERRFFKTIRESLGLQMGGEREEEVIARSEFKARLRARSLGEMRRVWLLAHQGSRQKFDQFTVYDNVNAPLEPYVTRLTREQYQLLAQMDALLNVPRSKLAANLEDLDQLIDDYQKTLIEGGAAPLKSRFTEVEEMTADFFEGQTEEQRKSKRKLAVWPYMFAYLHEEDVNKALKQRVLHNRLRQNPYVAILFRSDIDAFLRRQPKDQLLTAKEEAELFFKRVMMKNLVQTKLQKQRPLVDNRELEEVYMGGKSFASRVYNHQFNGTYKVVRQLMRIDLDPLVNADASRVMKFDMPLFSGGKDKMTSVHEELFPELQEEGGLMDGDENRPRRANTRPFYAGWDDDRRAFVLTNRFLPVQRTSYRMRINSKYPEFAPFNALGKERKLKAKSTHKDVKRLIAFTTWPIPRRISRDPLLYRSHPSAFMADAPYRHDVRLPSLAEVVTKEGRQRRSKARSERALIQYFIPDFDFRPLQILFDEADRPNANRETARQIAKYRIEELSPSNQGEAGYFTMDRWPSGFIVQRKAENSWWLEEKPPAAFVDRGGYVWPGHEQFKINIKRYLPQWKAPALTFENPFAKEPKDVKEAKEAQKTQK